MASSSTPMVNGHPQARPKVFINFRGDLRNSFVCHLEGALKDEDINYFIDTMAYPGDKMIKLFNHIEESKVALAIFSEGYSESNWCLNELVKIMERVDEEKLKIFPICFHVKVGDVKNQTGKFGENLRKGEGRDLSNMDKWKKALKSVSGMVALRLAAGRNESDFIKEVVAKLKNVIALIEREEGTNMVSTNISSMSSIGNASSRDIIPPFPRHGMKKLLKQLEEKIDFKSEETQIVGIVGMPGIGKTALAEMHHEEWENKFVFNEFFRGFREKSTDYDWVKNTLLNAQLQRTGNDTVKIYVVLDDVSDKKQLEFLRTNPGLIKKGSKIVITTRDKGLIEDLVEDAFLVPGLDDKEALQLFKHHAFNGQDYDHPQNNFIELSKRFVEYAGGNLLALRELGNELFGEKEPHWRRRLETLPHCCNENIKRELRISYEDLTEMQKHVFLDIACFFRSEEEDYLKQLLDTNSGEAGREVRDLADKFMINISAGRVEMHNLFCTLGKEIGSSVEKNLGKSRLWNHQDAREALVLKKGTVNARGIFLDMSKIGKGIALESKALIKMPNLRYLKFFDSGCPRQCDPVDSKVNLPDKLEFPLKEIRYLHWLKFPLDELPPDFTPENLIDLRLPYSKIQRVWRGSKDTPNLKWVDLTHSTNLTDISALSNATSLRRLSIEGCTKLDKLPEGIENMKSLAFLNLRGCTSLLSLPGITNLISLKTLILSDCTKFREFQVISVNLEYLHLDGTAIKGLPPSIQNLGKLIVLNLKDCNELESLPDCLDKLKALEELILSGCSRLTNFPHVEEIMENLQILLLDGTSIKELPSTLLHSCNNSIDQVTPLQRTQLRMTGLSLLRRLCLSRNDKISSLQSSISQLYHLKWIDLKHCNNLTSLSTLPPNLQCLDAHGCTSLRTVASPLANLLPSTEQTPSSFIFTNCEKLEHVAMNEIMCYAHNKSRLISDALNRQNKGLAFEALVGTCFPGIEVPAWFNHKASGAVIKPELPRHWSESGFVGIALCAIVSFHDYKIQNNNLMVKCICEFKNAIRTSSTSFFNCDVGGLCEAGNEQRTVKSTHVFIGFTSWLNINKCKEVGLKEGCLPTKASVEFKITDGTCEAANCEVLKCGFSFVSESDNGSWNASADANPMNCDSNDGALDANADESPVICESKTVFSDANVVGNSVVEGEIQGGGRFLGLLRRRGWF